MILFAKLRLEWLNANMKNLISHINKDKNQIIYGVEKSQNIKITDINILLNRIRLNNKSEVRKKLYFSTATALGLVLFGIVIF
tara:strand:- start:128 stop:376 length:249 start_codon:yes stop_codon:yes gene_type:complete